MANKNHLIYVYFVYIGYSFRYYV